jgi:hypothetical protein
VAACSSCAAGRVGGDTLARTSSDHCAACANGKYQSETGRTACADCAAGRFGTGGSISSSCSGQCAAGSWILLATGTVTRRQRRRRSCTVRSVPLESTSLQQASPSVPSSMPARPVSSSPRAPAPRQIAASPVRQGSTPDRVTCPAALHVAFAMARRNSKATRARRSALRTPLVLRVPRSTQVPRTLRTVCVRRVRWESFRACRTQLSATIAPLVLTRRRRERR